MYCNHRLCLEIQHVVLGERLDSGKSVLLALIA